MVAFDNLMHQMARESSFSGFFFFGAKSTFRVPRHSCARAFPGAPLAPHQIRWVSPHALRAAPCDAAVVGAAPRCLRICVLPPSVDADVPGAPAPFLDWGARRTPANTSGAHAGNGTRAARHCKICAPECRARARAVSEQRELYVQCPHTMLKPILLPLPLSSPTTYAIERDAHDVTVRGQSRTGTIAGVSFLQPGA
ncbi:hypothetical protein DFH08DRAFT_411306 [Mycena albidolilacea]|uniref:Uncharacterized protein n=1 Tax=Mycena albidolilacea TaxID=1033008 RepID=A0AAD7EZ64_9AGAR|nr:hypothetical protein DFH08DRAFT_411306 [Mycena albidolilacea]